MTCRSILENVNVAVSRRTLNNFLIRSDAHYKKHAQNLVVSSGDKIKRIAAVTSWMEKNIQWNSVIFSDEKRFTLDGADNW